MSAVKRAILIAAGRGKRLGPHTAAIPKGMVPIGAHSIIGWQWRALASAGIEELVVIRGYHADVMTEFISHRLGTAATPPRTLQFFDNHEWATNNVLLSLACARAALDTATLLLYSDIIFTPAVAQAAVASPHDIGLVIDRDFRSIYEGRTEHPLDEGEVSDLDDDGRVRRVGKRALAPADAVGEFIGLVKLSAAGALTLRARIDQRLREYTGRDHEPYQRAATFRNGYLTDVLQDLIDDGTAVHPVLIDGQWREIDTPQDLERAGHLVSSAKEWL
ncbi:MAG: phosphocholine cytidylyltransferase family protein [Kofleriaceae bacterium]|nr:phosphocholine cytidylyltransferase family protein [Kofleriaceae bacterium]